MRYERGRSGAEFEFSVYLGQDRSINIRVVAFDSARSLDDLEQDARHQLKRMLIALGKIGEDIKVERN